MKIKIKVMMAGIQDYVFKNPHQSGYSMNAPLEKKMSSKNGVIVGNTLSDVYHNYKWLLSNS